MYDTEQFVRHELSNGIVVWLQKPSILVSLRGYLSVFFKGVGSFIDPRGLEGLAHFVEHAVFCGSRSRPSAVSLSMPIFENGGFINAVTDELFTEHWCEIGKEYFHHAVQTLFETLTEPLFDEEDLKIEKAVVIREINDYQNIGGKNLINEHAMRFIYGKGHPIVRKIRGYPSSVERISTKDVRDFFEKYYHAGSANIVCGGSFSCIPNVLEILEEHFGRMKRGESVSLVTPPLNFNLTGRHVFSDRRYGVDELNLHYLSPRISYPEFIAPKMLFGSLTCNLIAPLMLELREKRGIVYGVTSNVANTLYGSIAGMECFIHKDKFSEAEDIFLNMLKNIDS
jgi:predicted Zn-dependent peptidase